MPISNSKAIKAAAKKRGKEAAAYFENLSKEQKADKIANEIKAHYIKEAINGKFPIDLNELSIGDIKEIIIKNL